MKNIILMNIILVVSIPQISISQNISYVKKAANPSDITSPVLKNIKRDILNPEINFRLNLSESTNNFIQDFNLEKNPFSREAEKGKESLIISNSISIGGFINNFAVINYKPELKTNPSRFISLYASRSIMSLIPINEMNKYYRTVAVQSALFFAIDNSVNVFLYKGSWQAEIAGFMLKNILMNLFFTGNVKENNRNIIPQINDEYYYYSVSIRF